MKSSSHRMVTAKAFEIWSDLMLEHPHDEVMAFGNAVADATPKVDDYL